MNFSNTRNVTVFAGNRTEESFRIFKQWEVYPIGAIIRALYDIENSAYTRLFDVPVRLREIYNIAKADFYLRNHSPYKCYDKYISTILEIDNIDIPTFFKSLFKFLPIQYNVANCEQIVLYCRHFFHPENDFWPPEFNYYDDGVIEAVLSDKLSHDLTPPTNVSSLFDFHWNYLLSDVAINTNDSERQLYSTSPREFLRILDIYSKTLLILLREASELSQILKDSLLKSSNRNGYYNIDKYYGLSCISCPAPIGLNHSDTKHIKRTCPLKKSPDRLYVATTLTELVNYEFQLIEENHLFVKTCACCKKPFITSFVKAKYCHFPNVDLGGKPCNKEAPRLKYLAKKSLSSQRNKTRDRYKKWLDPIVNERRDYIQNLKRTILSSTIYAASPKERKAYFQSIIQEVQTLFDKWTKDSLEAVHEFESGKITRDECEARIAYPSERERGPLLYDILDGKKNLL